MDHFDLIQCEDFYGDIDTSDREGLEED